MLVGGNGKRFSENGGFLGINPVSQLARDDEPTAFVPTYVVDNDV